MCDALTTIVSPTEVVFVILDVERLAAVERARQRLAETRAAKPLNPHAVDQLEAKAEVLRARLDALGAGDRHRSASRHERSPLPARLIRSIEGGLRSARPEAEAEK